MHYFLYGWKEGANPSEYLNAYPDVDFNPLLHYEWFRKKENRNVGVKTFLTERYKIQDEKINLLNNQLLSYQNKLNEIIST